MFNESEVSSCWLCCRFTYNWIKSLHISRLLNVVLLWQKHLKLLPTGCVKRFIDQHTVHNIPGSSYDSAICCVLCEWKSIPDIVTDLFKCIAKSNLDEYNDACNTFPLNYRYEYIIYAPSQSIGNNQNDPTGKIHKCLIYRSIPSIVNVYQAFKTN